MAPGPANRSEMLPLSADKPLPDLPGQRTPRRAAPGPARGGAPRHPVGGGAGAARSCDRAAAKTKGGTSEQRAAPARRKRSACRGAGRLGDDTPLSADKVWPPVRPIGQQCCPYRRISLAPVPRQRRKQPENPRPARRKRSACRGAGRLGDDTPLSADKVWPPVRPIGQRCCPYQRISLALTR